MGSRRWVPSCQQWRTHAALTRLCNLQAFELCYRAAHAFHAMIAVREEPLRPQSRQLCGRCLPLHVEGQAVYLIQRQVGSGEQASSTMGAQTQVGWSP
jgi:hypothetical protein